MKLNNRILNFFFLLKDQIVCLEKQVTDRVDELNKIKNDLKKNETTVAEQAQTIQNILNERDVLNGLIQKLTKEKVVNLINLRLRFKSIKF